MAQNEDLNFPIKSENFNNSTQYNSKVRTAKKYSKLCSMLIYDVGSILNRISSLTDDIIQILLLELIIRIATLSLRA